MAPNYYRGLIVALLVVFSVKLAQSDNFSNELQGQRDLDLETRGYIHVCGNGPEFMYTSPSKAVDTDGPTTSAGRANFCSLATSISSGAAEPQSSGAVDDEQATSTVIPHDLASSTADVRFCRPTKEL